MKKLEAKKAALIRVYVALLSASQHLHQTYGQEEHLGSQDFLLRRCSNSSLISLAIGMRSG